MRAGVVGNEQRWPGFRKGDEVIIADFVRFALRMVPGLPFQLLQPRNDVFCQCVRGVCAVRSINVAIAPGVAARQLDVGAGLPRSLFGNATAMPKWFSIQHASDFLLGQPCPSGLV